MQEERVLTGTGVARISITLRQRLNAFSQAQGNFN